MNKISVLFVCMGNICRSPTAEGTFGKLVAEAGLADHFRIDSAGTHDYHVGSPPDHRAQQTAEGRGIDLGRLRARRVELIDFDRFDYIVAMDRDNRAVLEAQCPRHHRTKISLLLQYAGQSPVDEVPDPYYGGPSGFERVFDLVEEGARGLLREIQRQAPLPPGPGRH